MGLKIKDYSGKMSAI